MSSARSGNLAVDKARREICDRFAAMLNAGRFHVRVRLPLVDGRPAAAWFYVHNRNAWKMDPGVISTAGLAAAIASELDSIASRQHADDWSARQTATPDWKQTDLRFHKKRFESRLGESLSEFLMGVLFRDAHASSHDRRRSIRRGARTSQVPARRAAARPARSTRR